MKVLDLFSGLGGFSQAFKNRGHEVITIDIEEKFKPDIVMDIMLMSKLPTVDVILASPPCNCFSVASLYRHWKNGKPTDEKTFKSIELVKHTLRLIEDAKPQFWIMENPTGMLRKQNFMTNYDRKEITQCQYGRSVMKPTDLWGKFPKSFIAKKCRPGSICHDRASRSSRKGIQAINNELSLNAKEIRAKLPYGLSLAICEACEREVIL